MCLQIALWVVPDFYVVACDSIVQSRDCYDVPHTINVDCRNRVI